ncbi:MAG: PrsW family intramembrane metalloprotease, partial [Candidatus Promineifilaceae bacterium]
GIIYGAMVGLGFAMVENYFYFSSEFASGGFGALGINVFFRAFVFGLNHALFSAAFGLSVAYARLNRSDLLRLIAPIAGWTIAVTLHALHNATVGLGSALCLIAPLSDWGGVVLTGFMIAWALRQEQQWLKEYLKEEVMTGTLTYRQYELASDWGVQRLHFADMAAHWQFGRIRRTRRFLDLCAKLASQKHHADLHPEDKHAEMMQVLRVEIAEIGKEV